MDEVAGGVSEFLLSQGFAGVAIIILLGVIVQLWRQYDALQIKIHEINELRVAELRAALKSVDTATASIESMLSVVRRNDK